MDYAMCNGLVMRQNTGSSSFIHAPCTLIPAPLPKQAFEGALNASSLFSKLIDKIARHPTYLETILTEVGENDAYTKKLLEILALDRKMGEKKQNVTLGLFRSDYMLQEAEGKDSKFPVSRFLQVENNTIAASFGCLSTRVAEMHRFLVDRFSSQSKPIGSITSLPPNNAAKNLAEAMFQAVKAYKTGEKVDTKDTAGGSGKPLMVGGLHIALVYFRAGYTPRDLPSEVEWDGYKRIELSRAIKCPCISYHLAGTKKIQQNLCIPGEVEKFLPLEDAKSLRMFFADQYGLQMPLETDSAAAIDDAIEHPEKYVLKPQREGGGNNLWLDDMKQALELKTMTADQRSAYILMRRIVQKPFVTALMRNGKVQVGECEKEVGIYASFLAGYTEPYQKVIGHLMRTKLVGVNEGGVASGYAVLDSPTLV
ncbi:hypothetical protein AAMO2058_001665900 [Amorphochlora amoebiformis]